MAKTLRLELLGGLRVTLDGTPVVGFISSPVPALLCYLAITGIPQFRPALAALLWSDLPEVDAATNLRQVLVNLRHLLDPYLLVTRQTVAFNRDRAYWLDVEHFEAHLAAGFATGDLQRLRAAVTLYRGDFLQGFAVRDAPAFDEWALAEQQRLRERTLHALHVLAVQHTGRGEYAAGIDYTTRLLALDPWREEAHRQLMVLLARSGQRHAALAQYATCRRVLQEELGVEPAEETTALYKRIQAAGAASRHNLPPQPTPLVGRHEELPEIARRLADPACRLVTIVGPGGTGKTRLALQAAAEAVETFLDGIYFVPLAAVSSAESLVSTLAGVLKSPFASGVDPRLQLLNYLRERELLLVLDNFEHLIEAGAGLLIDILQQAPEVKLLVTSRERLTLQEEWLFELEGLTFRACAPDEEFERYSAVQLFVQRAAGRCAFCAIGSGSAVCTAHLPTGRGAAIGDRVSRGMGAGAPLSGDRARDRTWVRFSGDRIAECA